MHWSDHCWSHDAVAHSELSSVRPQRHPEPNIVNSYFLLSGDPCWSLSAPASGATERTEICIRHCCCSREVILTTAPSAASGSHCIFSFQGVFTGVAVGFSLALWLAVGSSVYPPNPERMGVLPTSAEHCAQADATANYTTLAPRHRPER